MKPASLEMIRTAFSVDDLKEAVGICICEQTTSEASDSAFGNKTFSAIRETEVTLLRIVRAQINESLA